MVIPAVATGPSVQTIYEAEHLDRPKGTGDAIAWHGARALLRSAQLRPTRQREVLAQLIFGQGNRHFTAHLLYEEATRAGMSISVATVYNSLKHFTKAGMLAQIGVDGEKTFFDTNINAHHHFYIEDEDELIDVCDPGLALERMPALPDRYEVSRIDVVIRLRRLSEAQSSDCR
jgi:Fur family transcriptional regulator, iron response regulator